MNINRTVDAFRRFALACSGANMKIVKPEDCIAEKSKYAMIGMFIFLTSAFATLSSGYALYMGFKSAWLAAAIGVLWGVFIFNIDRFIISTIRKKQIDPDLPLIKKFGLGLWEIIKASPRIFLSVLISIVISTPLELKYFEPEIDAQIAKRLDDQSVQTKNDALQTQVEVKKLEDENRELNTAITNKENRRDQLRNQSYAEAEGTGGTRRAGRGPVYDVRRREYDNYEKELAAFRNESLKKISENDKRIETLRADRKIEVAVLLDNQKNSVGFLARLEAIDRLAAGSPSIWWAKIFIFLLILAVECTPIVMKLFASYGPYDSVLEAEEYAVTLKQRRYISDLNRKANHEEFFNTRKDSATLTVEEQLIRDAMSNLINLVQPEIDRATVKAAQKVVNDFETEFTSSNYSRN